MGTIKSSNYYHNVTIEVKTKDEIATFRNYYLSDYNRINHENKELENRYLLSELEYKNKEVVNFALHIVEKNDFLEQLQKTIAESDKPQNFQQINKLMDGIRVIRQKNIQREMAGKKANK